MDNPYGPPRRSRNEQPPPKTSFQRELEAKMRDRRSRGLSTDITPDPSVRDSEDELASDDELMSHFNMTSKIRSSPSSVRDHGNKSPGGSSRGKNLSGGLDEDRKKTSLYNEDTRKSTYDDHSRKSPYEDLNRKSPYEDRNRKSPYDDHNRKSTYDDHNRKSTYDDHNRKPPYDDHNRKSPYDDHNRKSPYDDHNRKSPYDEHNRTSSYDDHNRKSTYDDHNRKSTYDDQNRKSPYDSRNKTPAYSRSPFELKNLKSPLDRKAPDSAMDVIFGKRKDDDVDMMKTVRTPLGNGWNPPGVKSRSSPGTEQRWSGSRDEEAEEADYPPYRSTSRSNSVTQDSNKENRLASRSPGAKGRKTPTFRDSLDDADDKPRPTPRSRSSKALLDEVSPRPQPRRRSSKDTHNTSTDQGPARPKSRGTPTSEIFGSKKSSRSASPSEDGKTSGKRLSIFDVMEGDAGGSHNKKPSKKKGLLASDSDSESEMGKTRKSPFKPVPRGRKGSGAGSLKSPKAQKSYEEGINDRRGSTDVQRKSGGRKDYGEHRKYQDSSLNRKSPSEKGQDDERKGGRKSPWEEERDPRSYKDNRDVKGRKSPWEEEQDRRSYKEDRDVKGRKSPWEEERDRRSYKDDRDVKGRKSPWEEERDRRSYKDDRDVKGRKSPWDRDYEQQREDSRSNKSVSMDRKPTLRRSTHIKSDSSVEDTDHRDGQPSRQGRHKSRDGYNNSDGGPRSRSRTRTPVKERESSVCEDVEKDPTMKRGPSQERRQPQPQRKERQLLERAIDSIKDAQDEESERKMRYINPDKKEQEKTFKTLQSKTQKFKPKPRYAKPQVNDIGTGRGEDYTSTPDIRDTVFQQWYSESDIRIKKQKRDKIRKEKEEEEKKRKAWEEKMHEAKASYNCWLEQKKVVTSKDRRKKEMAEMEKKRKEEEENQEKRKNADLTFRLWKEDKDEHLVEKHHTKRKEEERARRQQQEKEYEKRKDAQNAFKSWKGQKEEDLFQTLREKKNEERRKERAQERLKREREREALDSYETWLEQKEKGMMQEQQSKKYADYDSEEEDGEYRAPWKPSSKTIPFGR